MHLTVKQLELLRVIGEANTDSTATDIDQILERLNYETSKESLHFSLRALVGKGLIEKSGREMRRKRNRTIVSLTALGKHYRASKPQVLPSKGATEEEVLESVVSNIEDMELFNRV